LKSESEIEVRLIFADQDQGGSGNAEKLCTSIMVGVEKQSNAG